MNYIIWKNVFYIVFTKIHYTVFLWHIQYWSKCLPLPSLVVVRSRFRYNYRQYHQHSSTLCQVVLQVTNITSFSFNLCQVDLPSWFIVILIKNFWLCHVMETGSKLFFIRKAYFFIILFTKLPANISSEWRKNFMGELKY